MITRSFSLMLACLLSILFTQPVFACSVCFVAKKENLMAFFVTGVLLSLLPFVLIGGVGLWLYRQAKARREPFVLLSPGAETPDSPNKGD